MTEQEIRIALAEWDGWKPNPFGGFYPPNLQPQTNLNQQFELPDYPNDLNAVHELEKLNPEQWRRYSDKLMIAVRDSDLTLNGSNIEARYKSAHATATQRCEALLRTLGLWVDK